LEPQPVPQPAPPPAPAPAPVLARPRPGPRVTVRQGASSAAAGASAAQSGRGQQPQHMGNIHVQGDDMKAPGPNFPWNRAVPMTKRGAPAGLDGLAGQLTPRQLSYRNVAFQRAGAFIQTTLHTAPPPLFRTFQNPNVIGDPRLRTRRVDIEIIRGQAFT